LQRRRQFVVEMDGKTTTSTGGPPWNPAGSQPAPELHERDARREPRGGGPAPEHAQLTARRRVLVLLEGQNRLLDLVASGVPLDTVLRSINQFIEAQIPGALCSILRLEDGRLWHVTGESLPEAYVAAINGFTIGPDVGSCGSAAFTGELTIASDLATHPSWQHYRHLALPHGLRAAWSMPIRAPDTEILGAFGIYTRKPAAPTAEHLRLIEVASHLAGLAMAQERSKRKLEDRARALAEADRQKDAFLAMLAHELRNPLAAIVSALDLMRIAGSGEALQTRAREVVGRQVGQLVNVVNDLLDVSRIAQDKIRLDLTRCEVRDIVMQAIEGARPMLDAKQHAVTVVGPDEPIELDGDRMRLVQVIGNLVGNAAKYTQSGGAIEIGWSRVGPNVRIDVSDTGEGMSPELLVKVFELFVQADRTQDQARGGLGIGLTVARSIVELHDGHVTASSPGLGQGSVFTVHLPVTGSESPATHARL
jgi:signal transduction histidine kinase